MSTMFDDLMTGQNEVDAFLAGEGAGYKVTVPADIDVKSIRNQLHMTQARFSGTFGFSLDAVKHWEGGRRTPEASARAYLTVIAKNPTAVLSALHPAQTTDARKKSISATGKPKTVRRSTPKRTRKLQSERAVPRQSAAAN